MNRRIFGWSLPPGVTSKMIDEAYGQEGPCAVCCKSVDLCICPECQVCEAQGDPKCYADIVEGNPAHGMRLNRKQAISRQEARIAQMQQQVHDEQMYLNYLESSSQDVFELGDSPDPYA